MLVVVGTLALLCAVLWPWLASQHRNRKEIVDGLQIRNQVQALTVFAGSIRGGYPLPSSLDPQGYTVAHPPGRVQAIDTTANLLSILIWNNSITEAECVSPAEVNSMISIMGTYSHDRPSMAVDPSKAMWDPAFSCDFTSATGGHTSYATLQTSDLRMKRWIGNAGAMYAVIGNRGPQIADVSRNGSGRARILAVNQASYTYAIHGKRNAWEGNIGYSDGHVVFELQLDPQQITYSTSRGEQWSDVLFFDETDDPTGSNVYLGVWVHGGKRAYEFKAVHD